MRGHNVMELNDLRKIICLKKLKYLFKEFQFIVIENLVEHGRHCLTCSNKVSMTHAFVLVTSEICYHSNY